LCDQCSDGQAVGKVALFAVDLEEHKQLAISQTPFYRRGRKGRKEKEISSPYISALSRLYGRFI
jgi:hypothetical protein